MISTEELADVSIQENQFDSTTQQIAVRMRKAVKNLREYYYKFHREEPLKRGYAFGGKPTESIGAFVEYNLRSIHCSRSLAGMCSPCFYSKFPDSVEVNNGNEEYVSFLKEQIDYIVDNFDEAVISKQIGKVYYRTSELRYVDNEPVSCCITPVGSFFDEKEMPTIVRKYLLERLISVSESHHTDIILYVESHVKDFNSYVAHYVNDDELNMFHRLHLRIVFGFESKNEYVRNVLYGKNLNIEEFEEAITNAKKRKLGTYAFTFVGLYPMTHLEVISDIEESFCYLKKLDVSPVVMFANIQEYTIADILIQSGEYRFLSPITVIEVIKLLLSVFGRIREDGYDAWLIADPVGGPPSPSIHIFTDKATECCSKKIYNLVKALREDHEFVGFDKVYGEVSSCPLHKESTSYLYVSDNRSIFERTRIMLDYIEKVSGTYLRNIRNNELLNAKAHLLCEGARIDDITKKELNKLGIGEGFIHSSNLLLDGHPVNACLMETFVEHPTCELSYKDGKFYLRCYADENSPQPDLMGEVGFIPIPEWGNTIVDGYKVSDYLRPHSDSCISIWPNQKCSFGDLKCRFCSLPEDGICLQPEVVVKMVENALIKNPLYEVHLSGGVYGSFSDNVRYYGDIAKFIHKKYPNAKISLETIPASCEEDYEYYKKCGVSSILMNIEVANEQIRKKICPGKAIITKEEYFQSYREAVKVFGKWNVGSVVMYGIEGSTIDDIIEIVHQLCEVGVYPVIMPFQPLKFSQMQNSKASDPDEYLIISKKVGQILKNATAYDSICSFGCINCGACSIENFYLNE